MVYIIIFIYIFKQICNGNWGKLIKIFSGVVQSG